MPIQVVINRCYGGFGLSDEALELYIKKSGITDVYDWMISRQDPHLVEVVRELGSKANGKCAKLKIVTVPDEVEWDIEEYDGMERISECHRTWQ